MELTITNTHENFETWLSRDFISPDLKRVLSKASILVLPYEDVYDRHYPLFPNGTQNILRYFKKHISPKHAIDICIGNNDYFEINFKNNSKRLGNFIIKHASVRAFTNVLGAYVFDEYIIDDKFKPHVHILNNQGNKKLTGDSSFEISKLCNKKFLEATQIKINVTLLDVHNAARNIFYEGPVTGFDNLLNTLMSYE